ncbi:MAG: mannitol dehydrogenase family protein [Bacillota bacterium]|nr:mannitol dehydrogenase family protein [Bacillota bacterium]
MKLSYDDKSIKVFTFDREAVKKATKENPVWVHFGCGNIFKAFHAAVMQRLLNAGLTDKGIIVAEGFDYEIIDLMSKPQDDLAMSVTLKADGSIEKEIIGSIVESVKLDSNDEKEYSRMKEIFRAASLQFTTFTITEKGYNLNNVDGSIRNDVKEDFEAGPEKPQSYIGKVAGLLYERFVNGAYPIAMVSTDNCSHNGDKLKASVMAYAKAWEESGKCEKGFNSYLEDESKVTFPWSMIDKITPRPDDSVKQMLLDCGFTDVENVETSKHTFVAPFVNAEEAEYLVIEDKFPNGRPCLEKGGVIFTDRETVDKVERMKVCTCLNPLHTSLAVFGCLLGYTKISDEMKDEDLVKLVNTVGYTEGLPVVINPGIIDPKEFIDTVVQKRIPNPFMPDTPQRIACDTSQKVGIRFGQTIKKYAESPDLDINNLKCIPLVLAAWCRYLMGLDDNGNAFEASPDPMYDELSVPFKKVALGSSIDVHELLKPLLSRADIFGSDLYEVGLGLKIENYFTELIAGPGAIRATLHKYANN